MIVYELPLNFNFPEGTNTPNDMVFFATMLGVNNTKGLWSIEPIIQDDESIPNVEEVFGIGQILSGDVNRLGYRRVFMPNLSISAVEEVIEQTKEAVN